MTEAVWVVLAKDCEVANAQRRHCRWEGVLRRDLSHLVAKSPPGPQLLNPTPAVPASAGSGEEAPEGMCPADSQGNISVCQAEPGGACGVRQWCW